MGARPLARRLAILACTALAGCARPAADQGRPLVVATIFPVADLIARVGGDAVRVETLLPPQASAHTWEATPAQVQSVSHARAYVTVGGGLDGWLEDFGADVSALRTLRLTDGMTLLRSDGSRTGEEKSGDPHVWLDPVLVRDEMLPRIAALIVELVPARRDELLARAAAMADSLTSLDGEIRRLLARRTTSGYVATHDAWAYFAGRYGLEAIGNLYEGPGHEPSARQLARIVDAARTSGLRTVLSEPQLSETAARALAAELDADVVLVDPLGGAGITGRESYLDLMRFNAHAFARALGAQ